MEFWEQDEKIESDNWWDKDVSVSTVEQPLSPNEAFERAGEVWDASVELELPLSDVKRDYDEIKSKTPDTPEISDDVGSIVSLPLTKAEIAEEERGQREYEQAEFWRTNPELLKKLLKQQDDQLIQDYFNSLPPNDNTYNQRLRKNNLNLALTKDGWHRKVYLAKAKRFQIKKLMDEGLIPDERRIYAGFWNELGRNTIGGALNVASGLTGTLASVSEGAIWDKSKLEEWANALHQLSSRPAFTAAKEGGWKGFVAASVGQAFPYMAAASASTIITGQPYAAFMVGFSVEGDNAYRTALENGASEEEAQMNRFVVGVINGAIEQIQINQLYKFAKTGTESVKAISQAAQKGAMNKIAQAGGRLTLNSLHQFSREALEETLQEFTTIAAEAQQNPEVWITATDRIMKAGLGGGTVGLILGGGGAIATKQPSQAIVKPTEPSKTPVKPAVPPVEAITPTKPTPTAPKAVSPVGEGKVEPSKLTDEDFPKVYREYGKITDAAEKDKLRSMTPEERALWDNGKNWEAFSRKRGYSEKEIEDFRYWLKLNEDPRAEAARGFEDLVSPKAVTEAKPPQAGKKKTKTTLRAEIAEDIIKNDPIYASEIEKQEYHKLYGVDIGKIKIYVQPKYKGEARNAIGNYPKLKFNITYDPSKGKHWDEIAMELGLEGADVDEILDRAGQALYAQKKMGEIPQRIIDKMQSSNNPYSEASAMKYEMAHQGFTVAEINENMQNLVAEYQEAGYNIEAKELLLKEKIDVEKEQGISKEVEGEKGKAQAQKERTKDLFGREELIGGASGKQQEFLDKEKYRLPEPDIEGQMTLPPAQAEKPRDILGGLDPLQQIRQALKEAKAVQPVTKAEKSEELRKRVGRAWSALKSGVKRGTPTDEAIFKSTGLLKGQLTEYDQKYESIEDRLEPGAKEAAYSKIYHHPDLKYFEIVNTAEAFKKLLAGAALTPDNVKKIEHVFGKTFKDITDSRIVKSPLYDRIITFWKAGLLTGIKTTGLNTLANLSHAVSETAKDVPASFVDSITSLFTGERALAFTTKGMPEGAVEGVKKGWKYLRTGYDERHIGEKLDYKAVHFGKSKVAKAIQAYEETIFHLLGAEDQPFYYGVKARSLYSQAIAQAKNKKLKGKERAVFIKDLIKNPTDDMVIAATHDAEVAVFQNRTNLGDLAKAIQKVKGGEIIVPFGRTPSAVAMQIVNYSPVGAVKEIAEQIHAGKFDQRKFSQAFGRAAIGTGALFIGGLLFKKGLMSLDYPDTERERELWRLEGRSANSIKVGDKWRTIQTLGPAGNLLIIGGHFTKQLEKEGSPTKAITIALAGGAKSFSEQTFVRGVNQAVSALVSPELSFDYWFSSMAGSAVPTIVADVARAMDDKSRRAIGPVQRLQSRIPVWREGLEPSIDVFGQDLPRYGGNVLETIADPTRPVKIRHDIVVDELRRLYDKDVKVSPTKVGEKKGYDILTKEENTQLWRRSGELTYKALLALVTNENYEKVNDFAKGQLIKKIVEKTKEAAKAEMVMIKLNQGVPVLKLAEEKLLTVEGIEAIKFFGGSEQGIEE
jgi:hypothetical protein